MSTPALEDQREKLRRALEAATAAGETGAPGAKELVESCGTALQAFDTAHPEVKVALEAKAKAAKDQGKGCLLYTSPSPRDKRQSRMPSSA